MESLPSYTVDIPLLAAARALVLLVAVGSAVVDLPRALTFETVSGQALLTAGYFCAGLALLPLLPEFGLIFRVKALPFTLFLLWSTLSLIWTSAVRDGLQNVLVMSTFFVLFLVADAAAANLPKFSSWLAAQVWRSTFVAAVIYGLSLLWLGPGTNDVFGARSFGLFALFGVAHQLARWRYGSRAGLLWASILTVLIGASLSRLALGIAIALFPLAQMPTRRIAKSIKMAVVLVALAALSYGAFENFDVLRDRFLSGDVSLKVGDLAINVSGRVSFWRVVYDSFLESPILGKGAGSSEGLIESTFENIGHPHSDYLRVAHDYGLIGLAIWCVALGALLFSLWRFWRYADKLRDSSAVPQLAAFLTLFAFVLEMTVDNAMVYVFVTAPLGLIVGAGLGQHRALKRRHSSIAATHAKEDVLIAC